MKTRALFLLLLPTTLSSILISSVKAQFYSRCNYEITERRSSSFREVVLERFGIKVDIPENYRTMLRQDGSVEILHPDVFKVVQCVARGGIGGSGSYREILSMVNRNSSLSLRQQAIQSAGYRGSHVMEYKNSHLSGHIIVSDGGYTYHFLGNVTGQNKLLKVDIGCDCTLDVEAITSLLSRIRPLNTL
ncbi:hypothetical protein [Picosynechococcus sp. PCC 8807]|uniref:hypothetical protein n=1 Tax=Picosynechococcus sp. PCC 8807 TaxID=195248 RepID=UPI0012EEBE61|nr:hypothetical protein [Picosynechococcus sp. PCC 8807]